MPYLTADSDKLLAFAHCLALRLHDRRAGGSVAVDVSLTRLTEVGTTAIKLGDEEVGRGSAIGGDGMRQGTDEIPMSLLGELVELFNQRFGESLTDADAIHPAQGASAAGLGAPAMIDRHRVPHARL